MFNLQKLAQQSLPKYGTIVFGEVGGVELREWLLSMLTLPPNEVSGMNGQGSVS